MRKYAEEYISAIKKPEPEQEVKKISEEAIAETIAELLNMTAQALASEPAPMALRSTRRPQRRRRLWRLSKPSSRGSLQKRSLPCKRSAELLYCPWNYFGITATVEDTDHTDTAEIWRLYGQKSTTKDVEQPFGERVGMIA